MALVVITIIAMGCGGSDNKVDTATTNTEKLSGKLTIFAAASLTDAFNEIAFEFRSTNPDVEVEFNFAGTPTLRTQLEQGARADLFASADQRQMELAFQNGVTQDTGRIFVRNSLVVITPASNPARITSLNDLSRSGIKLVVANPEVPVGAYSRQILETASQDATFGAQFSADVLANVVSLESNVKQVVAKVELGEADAGIVYSSDVTPAVAGKLQVVKIPERLNVVSEYPMALTREAKNASLAQAFMDFVLSESGQRILLKHGFSSASS